MCPTSMNCKLGIVMSHTCINITFFSSGLRIASHIDEDVKVVTNL
jgi:hypothetical protein